MGTSVGYLFHLVVTYNMDNKAFNHVIEASSSSWLQEHVTDMSERCGHASVILFTCAYVYACLCAFIVT